MAIGYRNSGGTDFDSLFEPYHSGGQNICGYRMSNGQDIGTRYQATGNGGGTAAGAVGFRYSNGQDIGPTFVALGTWSTGGTCVTRRMFVAGGKRAGKLKVGQTTRVTDPYLESHNAADGEVQVSEVHLAVCVRFTVENGSFLECSLDAPIPTRRGEYVLAEFLQGRFIPMASKAQVEAGGDHVPFTWQRVVKVEYIGEKPVQLLTVGNRNFWASGDGLWFFLHHNAKAGNP